MHQWGDGFDFDKLRRIENCIRTQCDEQGLILISKEKYGTIRYEHLVSKYTDEWDNQHFWFRLRGIIYNTIKLYPDFHDEILEDLASREEIVGKEVHNQYWTTT